MSSRESGGQSPPPEAQSGAQLNDTPGSGQGTDKIDNKEGAIKSQLEVRRHPRFGTPQVNDTDTGHLGSGVKPQECG